MHKLCLYIILFPLINSFAQGELEPDALLYRIINRADSIVNSIEDIIDDAEYYRHLFTDDDLLILTRNLFTENKLFDKFILHLEGIDEDDSLDLIEEFDEIKENYRDNKDGIAKLAENSGRVDLYFLLHKTDTLLNNLSQVINSENYFADKVLILVEQRIEEKFEFYSTSFDVGYRFVKGKLNPEEQGELDYLRNSMDYRFIDLLETLSAEQDSLSTEELYYISQIKQNLINDIYVILEGSSDKYRSWFEIQESDIMRKFLTLEAVFSKIIEKLPDEDYRDLPHKLLNTEEEIEEKIRKIEEMLHTDIHD